MKPRGRRWGRGAIGERMDDEEGEEESGEEEAGGETDGLELQEEGVPIGG